MHADEGGEGLHDRPVVSLGVARDALQRIDTAQARFNFIAAEQFHRFGESLGELAHLGVVHVALNMAPEGDGADKERHAAQELNRQPADLILRGNQLVAGQPLLVRGDDQPRRNPDSEGERTRDEAKPLENRRG